MREDFDWDHLPGTTVRAGVHPPEAYNLGTGSFAGGAGTPWGGACGFVLEPAAGDFVARKSIFFFERGFLAMGSGIRSTADRPEPIVTTVAQWAAPEPNLPLRLSGDREVREIDGEAAWEDVAWAWHDGVGYLFPEPVTLHGKRRGRLTTLWLDHGSDPDGATYAYLVLPAATLEETRELRPKEEGIVARPDETCHYFVGDPCLGEHLFTGAVFWEAGEVGGFKVDAPAVLVAEPGDRSLVLAVANPLHTETRLHVTVPGRLPPRRLPRGVGCKVRPRQTRLWIDTPGGRPVRIGLGRTAGIAQPPHEEHRAFDAFKVEADSEGDVTHLTVHVPAPALVEGYRLVIRGAQGHLRDELTDARSQKAPEGYEDLLQKYYERLSQKQ